MSTQTHRPARPLGRATAGPTAGAQEHTDGGAPGGLQNKTHVKGSALPPPSTPRLCFLPLTPRIAAPTKSPPAAAGPRGSSAAQPRGAGLTLTLLLSLPFPQGRRSPRSPRTHPRSCSGRAGAELRGAAAALGGGGARAVFNGAEGARGGGGAGPAPGQRWGG